MTRELQNLADFYASNISGWATTNSKW